MSPQESQRGFTLIELLMVVSIIGIIAVGAIPNLLRARITAHEAGAIGAMKTIVAAQTDYHNNSSPHSFAMNLSTLGTGFMAGGVAFIDENLAKGLKTGYQIVLVAGDAILIPGEIFPSYMSWSATAWPVVYGSSGVRSFYIDETAVVRGLDINGVTGTIQLPSID